MVEDQRLYRSHVYQISWKVRFDLTKLVETTQSYSIEDLADSGFSPLSYGLKHLEMIQKGRDYAEAESIAFHVISIASVAVAGRDKAPFDLRDPNQWDNELLPFFKLKWDLRPTKKTKPSFSVSVDFHFSRYRNGVIPQEPKPITAAQQKRDKEEAKRLKEEESRKQREARSNTTMGVLNAKAECKKPYCWNQNTGHCLLYNNKHYKLERKDMFCWKEAIVSEAIGPNDIPHDFVRKNRLKEQGVTGGPREKKKEGPSPAPNPVPTLPAYPSHLIQPPQPAQESPLAAVNLACATGVLKLINNMLPPQDRMDYQLSKATPLRHEEPHTPQTPRSRAYSTLPDAPGSSPAKNQYGEDEWIALGSWLNCNKAYTGSKEANVMRAVDILREQSFKFSQVQPWREEKHWRCGRGSISSLVLALKSPKMSALSVDGRPSRTMIQVSPFSLI